MEQTDGQTPDVRPLHTRCLLHVASGNNEQADLINSYLIRDLLMSTLGSEYTNMEGAPLQCSEACGLLLNTVDEKVPTAKISCDRVAHLNAW